MDEKPKKRRGRPPKDKTSDNPTQKKRAKQKERVKIDRSREIDEILSLMALEGYSESKACAIVGVAPATFRQWREKDYKLAARYARAREDCMDKLFGQIIEIADAPPVLLPSGGVDHGEVQLRKLQIESRKWSLSKIAPKKYGDKLELSGDGDNPIATNSKTTLDVSKLSDETLSEILSAKKNDAN